MEEGIPTMSTDSQLGLGIQRDQGRKGSEVRLTQHRDNLMCFRNAILIVTKYHDNDHMT